MNSVFQGRWWCLIRYCTSCGPHSSHVLVVTSPHTLSVYVYVCVYMLCVYVVCIGNALDKAQFRKCEIVIYICFTFACWFAN